MSNTLRSRALADTSTVSGNLGSVSSIEARTPCHGVKSRTFGPEKVPADHYYMLGDNRQYSKDSTFFGPIERKDLIGRAFMRIWPLSHLGFL